MRNYRLLLIALFCVPLLPAGCSASDGALLPASPARSAYTLRLPAIPPAWEAVLGLPEWRIEWLNPAGEKSERRVKHGSRPEISLPETWASPVMAWPCWPARGIHPGVFKPAGGLFPFDASGETISLGWHGGVDAVLYRELVAADNAANSGDAAGDGAAANSRAVPRLPQNFNWPRFRELFAPGSGINEEVRKDPWLADWPVIAAKTVKSGFDKRRLVPAAREELSVPAGPGPWIGSSPFAEPLLFEGTPRFPVNEKPDTWVSSEGILRCNAKTWILLPWE
jgi:hypothetical protein